ncbi:MAG: RluA family pseudouridine synthase [Bacteroidia bacterium]|nr:RluA family pseudouridine synthase [Bacteroidia bacterium]
MREIAKTQMPLQDFLMQTLKGISKTKVKQLLSNKAILVNGKACSKYNHILNPNDIVEMAKKPIKDTTVKNDTALFGNEPLKIIYEDNHIIVINKHEGLLSVSTSGGSLKGRKGDNTVSRKGSAAQITAADKMEFTAHSILNKYVKEKYSSKNEPTPRVYIVHRLDRETSGLMVFAKDEETKNLLQHNWEEIITDRRYVAVAHGKLEGEGEIRSYLKENAAFVVYSSPTDNGGQLAITKYKALKSGKNNTLVELTLSTGRKNQIRVHLKEIEHSILGDRKYGNIENETWLQQDKKAGRVFLHAYMLNFIHPVTGEKMEFSTPIPKKFLNAL